MGIWRFAYVLRFTAKSFLFQEENDKISRFRYKDDSLTALLGRLFLRQVFSRFRSFFDKTIHSF